MAKKDPTCVKITIVDIYEEIKKANERIESFQVTNEKAHKDILDKIELEIKKAYVEVNNAKTEHEKIRGSINLCKNTMIGIIAVLTGLVYIVLSHLNVKI